MLTGQMLVRQLATCAFTCCLLCPCHTCEQPAPLDTSTKLSKLLLRLPSDGSLVLLSRVRSSVVPGIGLNPVRRIVKGQKRGDIRPAQQQGDCRLVDSCDALLLLQTCRCGGQRVQSLTGSSRRPQSSQVHQPGPQCHREDPLLPSCLLSRCSPQRPVHALPTQIYRVRCCASQ